MSLAFLLSLALVAQDGHAAKTPEEAFRTFLCSMIAGDERALKAVTVPTDDFAWLLKNQRPMTPAQAERMKAQFDKMPIKLLKAGDTYSLPGDRTMKVTDEEVGEDRAVLLPQGAPMPTRCRRMDGAWRVDASPIIAGRKAAEAARKAAERETKKGAG